MSGGRLNVKDWWDRCVRWARGGLGPQTLVGALIVAVAGSVAGALATSWTGGDDADAKARPPSAAASSAAAAPTAPPGCFSTTCTGVDPKDAGCADGAGTIGEDWVSTMHLEIRYSSRCQAVWGKLTGAQVGDTIEIMTSPAQRQRAAVLTGHTKYTPMLPAGRQFSAQVSAVSVKGDQEHGIPAGYTLRVGADQDDIKK
ncbi:hypothetical protein GCM10010218_30920 [Streptomyces mashuensis]|uniref:DUF2690 domain-containing protein n=1 Tax=Streptomyces mashuensis TaxID=33904 RepID=A0A919B4Z5_9ACTN|nr:DUF2690 domain-containing protein [Streptomyces mashuensis]GHF47375.1 hypothetical protein GCM10010218_30920 [Streptomyces mashuensis]